MPSYISKDQGNLDFSVHDPFKRIKDRYREQNILGLVQVKLSQQHLWQGWLPQKKSLWLKKAKLSVTVRNLKWKRMGLLQLILIKPNIL